MTNFIKEKSKIFAIFLGCFLFRLVPFRAPNLEPIMASVMPVSKKYGAVLSFLFGFLSIFLYDAVTHFGSWTWITGITYGLIGVVATFYFKKYKTSVLNFAVFAIVSTIFYDLITGVLVAPIFGQTILTALALQIPFTILHLAGNIGFALTVSPALNKWIFSKESFKLKKTFLAYKKV
ncbi:MAG TPA: hypothetical protein PLO44_00140 [Candidatus Paceibacterota bacterium]|nr:hypothetical protein [Candidatus Paceibacterota bacterium]